MKTQLGKAIDTMSYVWIAIFMYNTVHQISYSDS